jgi:hypothetical protein
MKKILTILIIAFSFISCDNHKNHDEVVIDNIDRIRTVLLLCIRVENASGENLLDPATEGNILGNEIYFDTNRRDIDGNSLDVYSLDGYDYKLETTYLYAVAASRIGYLEDSPTAVNVKTANLNIDAGLRIGYLEDSPVLGCLWRSARGWRMPSRDESIDEFLTINWGDGTIDEIKLKLDKGKGEITTTIWLNGELYQPDKAFMVTIVK